MSSRPDDLYDAIYQQTEKQHEQVLRLVKEMTAHPEAFSEQEKEKINRMDIALQTATDILENLMTPDTQMNDDCFKTRKNSC
ncbi:hypothetical protein BsIDN1_67260 [Bacillus safensis]|uniref:Uncharacterized protein n=1 Tax=Bacillus safensis TaxID=561879 RepID=A0A5S9MJ24_BACIA|nr:hypothetical protein BsIDN1_67260 [Bacillus safensis]